MRIILMLCLFVSYLSYGQSDTLQVNVKEIDSTGKLTISSTIVSGKSTFYFGVSGGANDSYVITASPVPSAYTQGMIVIFRANTVNTGAASINVNGLGVKTIVKRVNTTLANGDIPAQAFCMLIYDGANFVLLNPVVN